MNEGEEFQKRRALAAAAVHEFVNKMDEAGLKASGFIFTEEADFLVRFGNLKIKSPQDFVQLHRYLSLTTVQLDAMGRVDVTITSDSTQPPSSRAKADNLALMLLAVPSSELPSQVTDALEEYLESRKS